jgi:hypothetical protein
MFRSASKYNIDLYTDSVSEFIRKCTGEVVPTVTIKTNPNQKPWMDGGIRAKLKARTTAFNHRKRSGNMSEGNQTRQGNQTSEMPVQGQSGVAGSTGNHGLQTENKPRHQQRRHASRLTKLRIIKCHHCGPLTRTVPSLLLRGRHE